MKKNIKTLLVLLPLIFTVLVANTQTTVGNNNTLKNNLKKLNHTTHHLQEQKINLEQKKIDVQQLTDEAFREVENLREKGMEVNLYGNANNKTYPTGRSFGAKEIDTKDLKSKEISMEINVSKTAEIFIENASRNLEIKTWDNANIKITTTVYFQGDDSKINDETWFEKLNINFKTLTNIVRIKSGLVNGANYVNNWASSSTSGVAVFDGEGTNIGTKTNLKRIVTIYVPKDNKLDVESKYADINLFGNYNKLNVEVTNSTVEIGNVKDLILRSKYSNVNIAKVNNIEAEFINGRFIITEVNEGDLDTKYSTVELGIAESITIKSTNDEYEIEELGSLVIRKNYGNLRITKLKKSIELDGTNSDLKLRNIESTVSHIKIDNKYADLRIPMKNIKNYTVEFAGPYSTVYSNFEKKPISIDTKKNNDDVLASTIRSVNRSIAAANSEEDDCQCNDKFKASVGDGKGIKIEIKCQNCTVDFK